MRANSIVAIDPGPERSAFVEWDGEDIYNADILDNQKLLQLLWLRAAKAPVVCEMIASYGMAVGASVFETCVWIGRFWEATEGGGGPNNLFHRIYRRDVKLHLCGSARAKDANVRQALIDRFGAPGTKKSPGLTYGLKSDLWAAFGVAVTWWDQNVGTK